MHYKRFLVLSPLLLLFLTSFSPAFDPIVFRTIDIRCMDYGPYTGEDGVQTFDLTYTFYKNKTYTHVYEALEGRYNGAIVSRDITDYHTLSRNQRVNLSMKFYPTEFKYNKNISIVFFIIDDATHEVIYEQNYTLYRKTPMNIRPFSDDEVLYESVDSIINLSNERCTSEKYDFSDTVNYFVNNNYYELLLDGQSFKYESNQLFTYSKAELTYKDIFNLFPYLPKTNGRDISLPLNIVQVDNRLSFSFKKSFYVEPNTLHISLFQRPGFIKTNRFYLPAGKKDVMDGSKFVISISDAGFNQSSITLDLNYYSQNNLFGYCHNSDYCITGEN